MRRGNAVIRMAGLGGAALLMLPHTSAQAGNAPRRMEAKQTSEWTAKGTLFEACSCSVPCPCNFGQPPSRGFCHTIYAYRLKTARYNGVTLDGLVFGGGEGDKGAMGFVDSRATNAQRPALEKLALAVFGKGGASSGPRSFTTVKLVTEDSSGRVSVGVWRQAAGLRRMC